MIFILILSESLNKSNRFFICFRYYWEYAIIVRKTKRRRRVFFMAQDDVKSHLDKGLYGTPLVNPEEQHKYLGTFRERCYLSMTVAEMIQPKNKENFLKELKKHPDASILLNGALPLSVQNQYIQLATKNNSRFTVVNDHVTANPEEFGLLLTAKEAVNEPVIDIEKKYPEENSSPAEKENPKKKKSFWNRLF